MHNIRNENGLLIMSIPDEDLIWLLKVDGEFKVKHYESRRNVKVFVLGEDIVVTTRSGCKFYLWAGYYVEI